MVLLLSNLIKLIIQKWKGGNPIFKKKKKIKNLFLKKIIKKNINNLISWIKKKKIISEIFLIFNKK